MANGEIQKDKMESAPWNLCFRSSKRFVITVVATAVFTDIFIYGMIIPILPTVLEERLYIPENQLQKWMSILLAAFGGGVLAGSPVFGYAADRGASRRLPFILGLLALGGATVMFWLARNSTSLIIARILQGLSGSAVWTVGLALIVDTAGKRQAGVAMGYVSVAMTLGTVSGPSIGGILLSRTGYHSVFVMAIALIALDIILRSMMIEPKTASKWLPKPEGEAEGLLSIPAGRDSNSNPDARSQLDFGLPEERVGSVPNAIRLLLSGDLLSVLLGALIHSTTSSSFESVLPVYVIRTFHWDPFLIGLCFVPLFIPSFFGPVVGSLVDRYGARKLACLGFLFNAPVFLLLQLVKQNSATHQVLLYTFLFLAGIVATLRDVSLMVLVTDVTERVEKNCPGIFGEKGGTAQAYGFYNMAWSGGQVLGPLLAGYLVETQGWARMVTVFGAMSGVVGIVLWRRPEAQTYVSSLETATTIGAGLDTA